MSRRVEVCVAGRSHELAGLAAEVVACVAALELSDRTLGLLLTLALHEDWMAKIDYGRLEADLTPKRAAVYHRRTWVQSPRRFRIGEQEDDE